MPDDKPKPQPTAPPSEAELSRIAREAVHQPADARLDRQLIRMGVIDADEPPAGVVAAASQPAAADQALVDLQEEIRRTKRLVWLLLGVIMILAIVIVGLLVR